MEKNNKNELEELFDDVLCIATSKVIESVQYSITHPTWFDKLLDKTLMATLTYIFNSIDKFFIIVLRLLKDELEKP